MNRTALSRFIATVGYVGYLRPGPGTWGSLAGCILAVPIIFYGSFPSLVVASVIVFFVGLWATQVMTKDGPHDPSEIVVDEVAGQWVALMPLGFMDYVFRGWGSTTIGEAAQDWWLAILIAFVLFRIFDIFKPWPVSWADRRDDAMGVMLDDVIAGIMAAIVFFGLLQVIAYIDVTLDWF